MSGGIELEAKFSGLEAIRERLKILGDEKTRRGFRTGLRKAAQVIANAAKERALRINDPETGQSIADNVAVRFGSRASKRTGDIVFRVGVMGTANTKNRDPEKKAGSPTPHWRFVEFGTSKVGARPFLRPAAEENAQRALDTFFAESEKALDRAVRRAITAGKSG
jgi:HK97 gp10 family phage protein